LSVGGRGGEARGGGALIRMHGRGRMTIDPRKPGGRGGETNKKVMSRFRINE